MKRIKKKINSPIKCGDITAFFVFPLTCAAEKHIISEKPLIQRFFKGTGVVVAGIECSPKIRDFRANGIPVQDRVVFFDTIIYTLISFDNAKE